MASEESSPAVTAVTCAGCGATARVLPLGWSTSLERGATLQHCVDCSRANLRSMEGKLDPQWWDAPGGGG